MNIGEKVTTGAASAGLLSFFKVIPWPEIAGFLSACYLVCKFLLWLPGAFRRWRKRRQRVDE